LIMRADVRDLETNGVPGGEDEQAGQPCSSASSDSNSNGDVKSPKMVNSSPKNESAKTILLSSPANAKLCKSCGATRKLKTPLKKKAVEVAKVKRKAGGEDPKVVRIVGNDDDDEVSDDEYVPGPSTSNDLDFGYQPSQAVPWATKSYYPLSIDGLHEEIVDCWQWIRPTRLETATRYKVFERVRGLIMELWPHHPVQVSVFGSLRTRLFLPSSDIDILVECHEWLGLTEAQLLQDVMQRTMDRLRHHFDMVSFHSAAFVPILKLSDRDTRLNIDISFNTVQGVKAATYMQQVKTEFPCVEPLLLLLKQYIFQNKMHEAYSGGLSSYGISLMLVNFFTIHFSKLRHVQPESDDVNLGYLLMRFLEVYGHELNYSEVAVDPSENKYIKRSELVRPPATTGAANGGGSDGGEGETEEERAEKAAAAEAEGSSRPVLLSVQDPLHKGNEVCRASFNIYAVRTLFQSALVQLRAVFVADRPGSLVWRKHVYKGSMLGRLLHFSPAQINFRYWLKGFVLSHPEGEQSTSGKGSIGVSTLIYGSILSEPSDLSCLLRIPKAGQRVLEIKRPEEAEEEKKMMERAEQLKKKQQEEQEKTTFVEYEKKPQKSFPSREQGNQWMTVGRGGRVYSGAGYQREFRYGNGHYKNSYYGNQQHQQPRQHNGGYQSKTWERMGGGNGRRFDDRKKSRSSEGLAEPSRPRRELTPQLHQSTATTSAATTASTNLSYKRSDSAVSSCSTTVMGTPSFSTASSSVSSPAINGVSCLPPPGFGPDAMPRLLPSVHSSSSPSGSTSFLSRHRDGRMSGRGEVYKPPAARKAAEAAAAAGTTTTAAVTKKKEPNGVISRPVESKSAEPLKGG
ncbi:hypothetical protein PMAYCL1PPCAC_23110, partial [Pristionchus mayeri]